jgi:uncharacterized membrane protein YqiK
VGTRPCEADRSEADLSEADLSEADLSEADLSEADLSEVEGVSLAELLREAGSELELYDQAIIEGAESLGKASSKSHELAGELPECSGSVALSMRFELPPTRGLGLSVSSRICG